MRPTARSIGDGPHAKIRSGASRRRSSSVGDESVVPARCRRRSSAPARSRLCESAARRPAARRCARRRSSSTRVPSRTSDCAREQHRRDADAARDDRRRAWVCPRDRSRCRAGPTSVEAIAADAVRSSSCVRLPVRKKNRLATLALRFVDAQRRRRGFAGRRNRHDVLPGRASCAPASGASQAEQNHARSELAAIGDVRFMNAASQSLVGISHGIFAKS